MGKGPGRLRYPLVNDHIAGWNIPIFNRKYIFNPGPFSIAMLDYRSVSVTGGYGNWKYLGGWEVKLMEINKS